MAYFVCKELKCGKDVQQIKTLMTNAKHTKRLLRFQLGGLTAPMPPLTQKVNLIVRTFRTMYQFYEADRISLAVAPGIGLAFYTASVIDGGAVAVARPNGKENS